MSKWKRRQLFPPQINGFRPENFFIAWNHVNGCTVPALAFFMFCSPEGIEQNQTNLNLNYWNDLCIEKRLFKYRHTSSPIKLINVEMVSRHNFICVFNNIKSTTVLCSCIGAIGFRKWDHSAGSDSGFVSWFSNAIKFRIIFHFICKRHVALHSIYSDHFQIIHTYAHLHVIP